MVPQTLLPPIEGDVEAVVDGDVVVVGGGLAGGLLALELARRGLQVLLVDPGEPAATALSYGLMTLPAAVPWLRLQLRHGSLGLRWQWARLASVPAAYPRTAWLNRLPLPVAQVEAPPFLAALAAALPKAGVRRLQGRVSGPPQRRQGLWHLPVHGVAGAADRDPVGEPLLLRAPQVVLAAGSGCRALWPDLDARLGTSWAGVLDLAEPPPSPVCWPAQCVLSRRFSRLDLERRARQLTQPDWVVDAGVVSSGSRWLAGQISLVRPPAEPDLPPGPEAMERWLRKGLAALHADLATARGVYRQVPVAFCTDGAPLVGAVSGVPGLWVFTGFTAAFTQVPLQAPVLAAAVADAAGRSRSQ